MDWKVAQPFWLAALAVLPLLAYYWRRSLSGFVGWQRAASLVVRVILVVVLVGALCNVRLTIDTRQLFVVFAVDRSLSISPAAGKAAEAFLDEARKHAGDNRSARLQFAARPDDDADRHATDLAAAIAAAEATTRPGYVPRVVLLSDGNQTCGDALAAAAAATMPIWTFALPGIPEEEVYVSAIQTRPQVRRGEPFRVDVVVQSTQAGEGTVRLLEETQTVVAESKHVNPGENHFRFRHVLTGDSEVVLTAELAGFEDTLTENNRASALVLIAERPRVLLIEGRPDSARPLAEVLKRQYIDVDTRPPDAVPQQASDLEDYQLLMLSNVPAASLGAERMQSIRRYVRDLGGGLIVVGGDRALTAGGYRGTALEEVLPVRCEVGKDRPKPGLALVLVIDSSASMEGNSIELAKQATRMAVEELGADDQVGVMAFEDDSRWVSDGIRPCSDKQLVLRQIDTITAGGGTNLYPAMEKAYLALHEAFADRKHMIVLSDGLSHPGDFETLTKQIAAAGITVSTVAVGEQAAGQLLQDIADRGKGQYHYCQNAAALPRVFVLEATTAGKLGIIEGLVSPRAVGAGVFPPDVIFPDGVFPDRVFPDGELPKAPPLLGYVQTVAKPESHPALAAENGDPLLIWWRYGRGTSVAFTSTVQSTWAPLWIEWPDLGPFWAQLVRFALARDESTGFAVELERRNDRSRLTLDAVGANDEFINGAEATLEIVGPNGRIQKVPLVQVAPGRYAAEFATPTRGPYRLETALSHGGQQMYVGRRGLVVGYAHELRLRPADNDLLRSIAQRTGGRYNPLPAEIFMPPEDPEETARRTTPCWPYFLMAAAMIFLVDVALKRIDLAPRRS